MKIKTVIKICSLIICSSIVSAQDLSLDSVKIKLGRYNLPEPQQNNTALFMISASSITAGLAAHNYNYQHWWKENSSKITFTNSLSKQNYINKAGKFYSTNLIAHFYSASLEASGINYEKATIYSAAIALAYGTYIETYDGFSKNDDFNFSDYMFNIFGAGYVLGQYYIPELKNIQPRFSYYPTKEYLENSEKKKHILSDIGGQKFWLGIRVKQYLPDFIADLWPSILMVSIGVGVNNSIKNDYSKPEYFIALDIDAEEIPLYGYFWQFIKNTLNYFHFPMPGIRISPNAVAFMFCY